MRLLACAALLLAGCAAAPPSSRLAGTSWELVALRAGDPAAAARPADPARYTLDFDDRGGVAARLDCNRGRGSYTETPTGPDRGRLAFGPMAVTRALCPPGSLGERLAGELPAVRAYVLGPEELRLELAEGGAVQLWRRAAR